MKASINQSFDRLKDRLSTSVDWFPFPALILFGVVLIIVGKTLPGINPKVGSRSQIMRYETSDAHRSAITISISPHNEQLLVTSKTGEKFLIPAVNPTKQQIQPLSEYLRKEASQRITSLVLLDKHFASQTTVILAADERLKFEHLRGIITALADAGINSYAFETAVVASGKDSHRNH